MIRNLYILYGVIVLGTLHGGVSGMESRLCGRSEERPRSVRDNPGSYRSVYGYYHHYTGGK